MWQAVYTRKHMAAFCEILKSSAAWSDCVMLVWDEYLSMFFKARSYHSQILTQIQEDPKNPCQLSQRFQREPERK